MDDPRIRELLDRKLEWAGRQVSPTRYEEFYWIICGSLVAAIDRAIRSQLSLTQRIDYDKMIERQDAEGAHAFLQANVHDLDAVVAAAQREFDESDLDDLIDGLLDEQRDD